LDGNRAQDLRRDALVAEIHDGDIELARQHAHHLVLLEKAELEQRHAQRLPPALLVRERGAELEVVDHLGFDKNLAEPALGRHESPPAVLSAGRRLEIRR
jgi:hypothetical protein